MTTKTQASLCVAIALSLSISVSASAQSAAPIKPLPPAAIALKKEIDAKQAYSDELKQKLEATQKSKAETSKKLAAVDTWEQKVGISMESFPEIIKNLQSKRIDLMIDLTGLEAKREAILAAGKQKNAIQLEIMKLEQMVAKAKTEIDKTTGTSQAPSMEDIARLQEAGNRLNITRSKDKTTMLLAESMLTTSLELAEKKARLTSVEKLLAEVLPARKELESSTALKSKSQRALEQEKKINEMIRLSELELEKLNKELQEIITN